MPRAVCLSASVLLFAALPVLAQQPAVPASADQPVLPVADYARIETPLLLEEGDADGNVNYWQSMELYNFGRRLGKRVILLLYNDENHGVARPESQRDYHTRQLEWFAHYLKGEPAAAWITNGETYLTRQKLIADAEARRKKASAATRATASASRSAGDGSGPNP